MKEWLSHVVTYVCVMALLTVVWALTSGHDGDYLRELLTEDRQNLGAQFWPIWPMLGWGIAVAIHTAVFVLSIPGRTVRAVTGASRRELAAPEPPADDRPTRKWLAVMFTDVVGSTTLNERLGDDIWHPILAAYRELVRLSMARHGGAEVTTVGDGFLVRFDSPTDAVRCAVDIQRALEDDRAGGGTSPNVRIGIHAGEVVEDSGDLLGHVVNLASRVSDAAEPDEILLTEPVADRVDGSVDLEDRGLRPLKGIAQPRHLLAVRW